MTGEPRRLLFQLQVVYDGQQEADACVGGGPEDGHYVSDVGDDDGDEEADGHEDQGAEQVLLGVQPLVSRKEELLNRVLAREDGERSGEEDHDQDSKKTHVDHEVVLVRGLQYVLQIHDICARHVIRIIHVIGYWVLRKGGISKHSRQHIRDSSPSCSEHHDLPHGFHVLFL